MLLVLKKIVKFNNLILLGVYMTNNGHVYYTLNVKKKGDKLNILSSSEFDSFEALANSINLKLPVVLLLDGKGVLNKKIDLKNEQDLAWRKNLDFNTIYFTNYKVDENLFLSFARKKTIDEVISFLVKKEVQLVDFYVGPLLSGLLQKAIGRNTLLSNDSTLEFNEGKLAEITKSEEKKSEEYSIGNYQLSQYHLPLYGAAIHFYIKQPEIVKNESKDIIADDIIYKKAFNFFGAGMLITFLVALLASYLLIQYYSVQNVQLNEQNLFSNKTYEHIINLEQQKEHKLKILNQTGQMSKRFITYYVYTLSASVPAEVQISGLKIFPLSKEVKPTEKVNITPDIIIIKGSTGNEAAFDNWLGRLKKMDWIKRFEILSLKKDKKNIQQFEIKILIEDV